MTTDPQELAIYRRLLEIFGDQWSAYDKDVFAERALQNVGVELLPIRLVVDHLRGSERRQLHASLLSLAPAAGVGGLLPPPINLRPDVMGERADLLRGHELTVRFEQSEQDTLIVQLEGGDVDLRGRVLLKLHLADGSILELRGAAVARGGSWECDPKGAQILEVQFGIVG